MNKAYREALQAKVIQEYVRTYNRSPNELELRKLLAQAEREYPSLEQVGFAGHLITKPPFASSSSASDETTNRQAIHDDTQIAGQRLKALTRRLENSFRALYATGRNLKRRLDDIESRIDNVLLLSGTTDAFVYGVEENFVVQDKIDFARTTASVESGFATTGRAGYGLVDLQDVHITYSTLASKGVVSVQNTSNVDTLKYDDGSFWDCLVYTNYKQGRVSLLIDVALDSPQFISELRFTSQTGGANSRNVATVFYSLDGNTFKAVNPQEVNLTTEENLFNIGLDGVRKIRIMLSKDRFDSTTALGSQFVYVFSLDSLKLYSKSYTQGAESILFAGPYEVLDELGKPVNFTKATVELCLTQGEEDMVSMFLSNNGTTYLPVDHGDSALGFVSFTNGSMDGTYKAIDESLEIGSLTVKNTQELASDEAHVNLSVLKRYAGQVARKSILVRRNVPWEENGVRARVYDQVPSGWSYDAGKKLYRTTLYVSNEEGQSIDLGNTSAYLNGLQVSGLVLVRQGFSVFETSSGNWQELPTGLMTVSALRKKDPLYPYNHKYLIEGYQYADTFRGDKIYIGVEQYFGELLIYVPPELFASPDSTGNLKVYTLDDLNGRLLFTVKVNKSDSAWQSEKYQVDYVVSKGESNQVWFKAVLNSAVDYSSPVLSSIRIKVI